MCNLINEPKNQIVKKLKMTFVFMHDILIEDGLRTIALPSVIDIPVRSEWGCNSLITS